MKTHGITAKVAPPIASMGESLHVVTIERIRYVGLSIYSGNTSQGAQFHTLSLHIERFDVESLILQLTGQLAKLDQDAETAKELAR